MLLVKTKVGSSNIHGLGLFADEFIPEGTKIWEFTAGFDLKVSEEDLKILSEPAREQFLNYCYYSVVDGKYVLCFDDARFFNHSDNPNTTSADSPSHEEGMDVAARDIQPGEEITCDCREFDVDCRDGLESYC